MQRKPIGEVHALDDSTAAKPRLMIARDHRQGLAIIAGGGRKSSRQKKAGDNGGLRLDADA